MILLRENLIVRGDLQERIKRWEVWFRTPWGVCSNTADACEVLLAAELDPNVSIIPISVAVGETTHEVWLG